MGTRRKERQQQFIDNPAPHFLAHDLVESAIATLGLSLGDRRRPVFRSTQNHYSPNALSAVVMFTTALDVGLTEVLSWGEFTTSGLDRQKALTPMVEKFAMLAGEGPSSASVHADVALLSDVRDEMVHYLPRQITEKENVPSWFQALHQSGLFIESPNPAGDFYFAQKLPSYALAYWSARVSARSMALAVAALPPDHRMLVDWLPGNFALFDHLCPPESLAIYDRQHGLEVTRVPEESAG